MDVVVDTIKEFTTQSGTAKASGKPYTVNLAVLDTFGPVSLGFNKPDAIGLMVGGKYAMEVEFKYGKWEYQRTVDIDTKATLTTPPAKAASGGGGRGYGGKPPTPFPVPDNHGDMSIIHQNSLSNALRYYELRLKTSDFEEDNADMPTTAEVIELAYEFADFSSGKHLERMAKEK